MSQPTRYQSERAFAYICKVSAALISAFGILLGLGLAIYMATHSRLDLTLSAAIMFSSAITGFLLWGIGTLISLAADSAASSANTALYLETLYKRKP